MRRMKWWTRPLKVPRCFGSSGNSEWWRTTGRRMKRMPGIYCGNRSKRVTEVLGVWEHQLNHNGFIWEWTIFDYLNNFFSCCLFMNQILKIKIAATYIILFMKLCIIGVKFSPFWKRTEKLGLFWSLLIVIRIGPLIYRTQSA